MGETETSKQPVYDGRMLGHHRSPQGLEGLGMGQTTSGNLVAEGEGSQPGCCLSPRVAFGGADPPDRNGCATAGALCSQQTSNKAASLPGFRILAPSGQASQETWGCGDFHVGASHLPPRPGRGYYWNTDFSPSTESRGPHPFCKRWPAISSLLFSSTAPPTTAIIPLRNWLLAPELWK